MKLLQKAEDSNTIIGNSFLIFLIRFFPSLATLLVVVFFSRNLSETDYGSYQNFWVQLFLLSSVATIGIPAFLLTYTPVFVKQLFTALQQKYYIIIACWIVLLAIVFSWIYMSKSDIVWFVPLGFFIVYSLNAIAESMLIVFRQFKLLLWVNVAYTIFFLLLHSGVLDGSYNIETVFLYLLLLGVMKLFVTGIKAVVFLKSIKEVEDNEYTMADIRSLWMHVGIYDVMQRVFTWIDKFAISLLFAASVSAVYFNGTFDIPFLPLLLGAVSSAALIQMSGFTKKGDTAQAIIIANQTARILSAVVFPLFFFLFLFREELFNVILTTKYEDAIPIFAVTVCVVPLRAYNFTSILQNRHKGRVINTGALLDILIAISLMYPLYQLIGLTGIAMSFVISSYVQGVYYLYQTGKVLQTPVLKLIPLGNWLAKLILFGCLFVSIHYILVLFFTQAVVLALGSLILAFVLLVALVIEFKVSKKLYG